MSYKRTHEKKCRQKSGGSPMETVSKYPADFDEFTNPPTEVSPMSIIIEFVVHVYPQNPLLWSIIRLPIWKFWNFREKKTPNRPNYFLDFPIIGPKKKVAVNFIYGYQNLSGEKYKSNGKRISSIRHTSEEKNPKNHPKMPYFRKVHFFCWPYNGEIQKVMWPVGGPIFTKTI